MGLSVQPLEVKRQVQKPITNMSVSNLSPWYASLTNKTWKRAILFGVLTFVCVMLAFTIWGLVAEMSVGAIIMGGLGFGGLGFSAGAGTYYVSQKCCCRKPSFTDENDQMVFPHPAPRLVKENHTNTDQKPSCPVKQKLSNSETMSSSSSKAGLGLFHHRPVIEMSEPSLRKSQTGLRR
jgi:hypothetical protein